VLGNEYPRWMTVRRVPATVRDDRTRRTDRLIRLSAERLFESGGFELMKEAHALFAGERPRMARNLEMVWDGVGTWGG
jgi:hypothetical protein